MDEVIYPVGYVAPVPVDTTYEADIQQMMETAARGWGYDSVQSVISYRGDANLTWDREGSAFFAWRSAVWQKALSIQNAYQPGDPVPTLEDVLAQLPALVRPQ